MAHDPATDADPREWLAGPFGLTREQVDECARIRAEGSAGALGTLSESQADRFDALRGRPLADVIVACGLVASDRRDELERALQATLHHPPSTASPCGDTPVAPTASWGSRGDTPRRPTADAALAAGPGAPADPSLPASPGTPPVLGRYRILRLLGRGGMGVVYLAHDAELRRDVALKRLLSGSGAQEEEVERFLREARAAARLAHPGIAQVYDAGIDGGAPFITMEYVPGGNLAQRLRAGRPTPREAAALVHAIAEAVAAAHARGIVHRDLKPENVLLDDAGRPKVGDFGLARVVEEEAGGARRTRSGALMGTPAYMAPEQAQGDLDRVGPASDVYALGTMLYEMSTGRLPYPPERPMAVLVRKLQEDPPRPRAVAPDLARDLATVIEKAMARDPMRRYATAGELAEDLARWLAGETVRARPATVGYRAWTWVRRHRGLAAGLAVAGAAGLAAIFALRDTGATRVREARLRGALEAAGRAALGFEDESFGRPLEEAARRTLAAPRAETIETLLREQPDDPRVLAWRGWLRGCLGSDPEARADLDRACALATDGADVFRLRGRFLLERVARRQRAWITRSGGREALRFRSDFESTVTRADRQQGVQDLERALQLDAAAGASGDDPEVKLTRVLVLLYGDRPDPRAAIDGLAGLEGPRAETLRARAEAALGRVATDADAAWGHANRGIWACRRGVEAWQGSPALRCDLGFAMHVYEAAANRDANYLALACEKAEAEFGLALELVPQDPQSLLGRAQAGWVWAWIVTTLCPSRGGEIGRSPEQALDEAVRDLAAAERLAGPDDPWPHAIAAEVSLTRVEAARFVSGYDPRDELRRALAACDQALQAAPGMAEFLCTRALAGLDLARAELTQGGDALAVLERAAADGAEARRLSPQDPEAAAAFATAYVALARARPPRGPGAADALREVLVALDAALAGDPPAMRWRHARGSAGRLLAAVLRAENATPGDVAKRAEEDLRAAIAAGYIEAWEDLAELLAGAGRVPDALAAFKEAAALPGRADWARGRIAELGGDGK